MHQHLRITQLFIFFSFLLFPNLLIAKVYVYELGEEIETVLKEGIECLKAEGSDCDAHFQRVLELARATGEDSTLAMSYFEICTAFDYHGSEEDRVSYAREGLSLDGRKHAEVTNRLYRELGSSFRRTGALDSIIPTYTKAMEWAKYAKDTSSIAATYIQLSGGYRRLGNVKKSIEILLEGEPYAKASGDIHRLSGIQFNLAAAYYSNQDLPQAIEKYDEAIAGFLSIEDSVMMLRASVNRAMSAIEMDDPQYAIDNLPIAIDFFMRNEPNSAVYASAQYARALVETDEYVKAIPILEENIERSKAAKNQYIELVSEKLLSECYLQLGNKSKALTLAEHAYNIEKERGFSNGFVSALDQYIDALKANDRLEAAVAAQAELLIVKDTLFQQSKVKEIAGLQAYYEAEKREAEIALLTEEVKVANLQKVLLLVGLLGLVVILGLIYLQFKERVKRVRLEKEKLNEELSFKKKELTSHALHLAQKNEVLLELKEKMGELRKQENPAPLRTLVRTIDLNLKDENSWDQFIQHFEQVHTNFNKDIQQKFPGITPNELRLLALLKMNLSSKEIANLLNITTGGVKKARHRLRKKLQLSAEQSLESVIFSM